MRIKQIGNFFRADSGFYSTLLRLSVPIIIQNIVSSSLFIVDNIMIGQLGEVELAAVTQSNQWTFLLQIFIFGIASGSAIYGAQFFGKRDMQGVRSVMGLGMCLAGIFGIVFACIAIVNPAGILSIYSNDPKVIEIGSQYISTVAFGYIIVAVNNIFTIILKSTEQVRLPMAASITAILTNTFLNYCLIFGNFGFPQLGVRGAAIATVCAAAVECAVLFTYARLKNYEILGKISEFWPKSKGFIKRFFKVTLPVICNEGFWALGISAYAVVYGRMGTQTVAAVSVSGTVERLMFVLVFGIGHATSIIVGKQIGAGDEKRAYDYAKRLLVLTPASGLLMAVIIVLTRGMIINFFNVSQVVKDTASSLLVISSCLTVLNAFNFVNIVGILRAGGDTIFSMILDLGGMWAIGVPLVSISALVLGLSIEQVYIVIGVEGLAKLIVGLWRFRSKKWINNLVKHEAGQLPEEAGGMANELEPR